MAAPGESLWVNLVRGRRGSESEVNRKDMLAGFLCFILCSHLHAADASNDAACTMLLFLRMTACGITVMSMTMPRA